MDFKIIFRLITSNEQNCTGQIFMSKKIYFLTFTCIKVNYNNADGQGKTQFYSTLTWAMLCREAMLVGLTQIFVFVVHRLWSMA